VAGDNTCQKGEQVPKVSDEGDILSPLLSILKIDLNNNNVHLFKEDQVSLDENESPLQF